MRNVAVDSEVVTMIPTCSRVVMSLFAPLFSLIFTLISGCSKPGQESSMHKIAEHTNASFSADLNLPGPYLSFADLVNFRSGRARREILEDLHWRGVAVEMIDCNGTEICAITYNVDPDGPEGMHCGVTVHAIFVDNKFVKFIQWLTDPEDVPLAGSGRPVLRPLKVGDCLRLTRAVEAIPVSVADLEREALSATSPPEHTDWGLTIAMLLLRQALPSQAQKAPTGEDFRRNAVLCDQFKAARLNLGMTESDVEGILKAMPLEAGSVDAGVYKIYGSNESFNIDVWLHFSNVLVVFRGGKATAVCDIGAGAEWRRALGKMFVDMPKILAGGPSGK